MSRQQVVVRAKRNQTTTSWMSHYRHLSDLAGAGGEGTNPEQLFGAGYAACFIGAMGVVAGKMGIELPAQTSVNAKVAIGPIENGFGIAATLNVSLVDMDRAQAQALVDAAHQVCPYSNATRGNIEVTINLL